MTPIKKWPRVRAHARADEAERRIIAELRVWRRRLWCARSVAPAAQRFCGGQGDEWERIERSEALREVRQKTKGKGGGEHVGGTRDGGTALYAAPQAAVRLRPRRLRQDPRARPLRMSAHSRHTSARTRATGRTPATTMAAASASRRRATSQCTSTRTRASSRTPVTTMAAASALRGQTTSHGAQAHAQGRTPATMRAAASASRNRAASRRTTWAASRRTRSARTLCHCCACNVGYHAKHTHE